mgnify:FL=1
MTYAPTVQKTIELLQTLISFDTTSRESNLGLIEYVRDHLQGLGMPVRLSYDAEKRKANLFATLGDPKARGIVLCGHTDVVPVDGQAWNTDPFKAHIADGKIYGRGAVDMKGYIAASLAMLPAFMNSDLKQPLNIGLTYDEEVGCIGVQTLIRDLAEAGIRPAGCFVGEPTGMQVMTGHKGMRVTRCRVRGLEAHSSMAPEAVRIGRGKGAITVRARMSRMVASVTGQSPAPTWARARLWPRQTPRASPVRHPMQKGAADRVHSALVGLFAGVFGDQASSALTRLT